MPNLNRVFLMGNVTRDHELKYTPKGSAVLDFSLAINRSYKTESGERREDTTFVDLIAWARTAEVIKEYAPKGSPLFVEGRLQQDTWEDKATGQKRSRMRVVCDRIQLIGGKRGEALENNDEKIHHQTTKQSSLPSPVTTEEEERYPDEEMSF